MFYDTNQLSKSTKRQITHVVNHVAGFEHPVAMDGT